MTRDTIVGIASAIAFGFLVGYWAGEERSTIEMKPCPLYEKQSLSTSTRFPNGEVVCSYANSYGKAKKQVKI